MYKSYQDLGTDVPPNQDQHQVLELANSQHKQQILENHSVVVIDVYADWCGPCKQISPAYGVLASTYSQPGLCAVVKYSLDRMAPQEKAGIHGIPLFQFYVNGKKTDNDISGGDLEQVENTLKSLLQRHGQHGNNGPQHNKNTIRATKFSMPSVDAGQPYRSNGGGNYLSM